MPDDLIERLRLAAKIHRDIGGQTALAATIEEAADALSRAEADARRYRWLREADNYPDYDWWANELGATETADEFDAAIDAAMGGEEVK